MLRRSTTGYDYASLARHRMPEYQTGVRYEIQVEREAEAVTLPWLLG